MIKLTLGRINRDGTKAVYLTDAENDRIFGFWYDAQFDNPNNLKPKEAICEIIAAAGYNDLDDYYTHKKKQINKL